MPNSLMRSKSNRDENCHRAQNQPANSPATPTTQSTCRQRVPRFERLRLIEGKRADDESSALTLSRLMASHGIAQPKTSPRWVRIMHSTLFRRTHVPRATHPPDPALSGTNSDSQTGQLAITENACDRRFRIPCGGDFTMVRECANHQMTNRSAAMSRYRRWCIQ